MAQFFILGLVLMNVFVAMASENAEAPTTMRKLGKHRVAPSPSPEPHAMHPIVGSPSEGQTAPPVTESNSVESVSVEDGAMNVPKHHRSMDGSVAGGGVILGGLATTFLVAVFCYIRATGRHKLSETHQTDSEKQ